jgi:hypothetical protein
MTKNAIIFFSFLLILWSCRKEEPVKLPENGIIGEAHCSNGIMDADEDGIDCGPSCEPCILSIADCGIAPVNNTFKTTGGVNLNFQPVNVTSSVSTGVLVITATSGASFVRVTFANDDPVIFTAYNVENFITQNNEVTLEYYNGSGWFDGYSDQLHLNRIGGKLSVEFCDVYMSIPTGGYTIGSGKLTVN